MDTVKQTEVLQRRFLDQSIVSADGESANAAKHITGYAAVFNTRAEISPGYLEQISPGAFSEAIERDDVRALLNHDPNIVLGRKKAGTLKLHEDARGLFYEISPPDTTAAVDLMKLILRGDVTGSSFSFTVLDQKKEQVNGALLRTVKKARLFDISIVTYPAYEQAGVVSARYVMPSSSTTERDLFAEFEALKKQVAYTPPADDDPLWRRFELLKHWIGR